MVELQAASSEGYLSVIKHPHTILNSSTGYMFFYPNKFINCGINDSHMGQYPASMMGGKPFPI